MNEKTIAQKLTEIAEIIPQIYEAAYAQGLSKAENDTYQQGLEAGKEAQWDLFWDNFQSNGERSNYYYAFYGSGWNDNNFKPKYDLKFDGNSSGQYAFRLCKIANLKQALSKHNVKLDFTLATTTTSVTNMFYDASELTDVPELDLRYTPSLYNFFYNCKKLKNVDKMIISESCTNLNSTFANCLELENITFEGTIKANINLTLSTLLTKASLMSLINCLADINGEGLTRTATLGADNLAKLTEDEKAIATAKGWALA